MVTKILVVDENDMLRNALLKQLSTWGIKVYVAAGKADALEMIQEAHRAGRPFDMAIIDSSLSDVPGSELVDAIKARPELDDMSVIMLTPLADNFQQDSAHAGRVDRFIRKPLFGSTLFNTILSIRTGAIDADADAEDERMRREWIREWEERRNYNAALDGFADENDDGVLETDGDKGLILIAEDNRINQIVVSEILRNRGYRYDIVPDGKRACEAVTKKDYDMILMDCQMPVMDGFQATQRIRRMEADSAPPRPLHRGRVPIIALTANVASTDEERCLEAGMDGYCSKPINELQLVDLLKKWVRSEPCL